MSKGPFTHRTVDADQDTLVEPDVDALEHQQAILLGALLRRPGSPVSFAELQRLGIEFPASVVSELELMGVPLDRCVLHADESADGSHAMGVRLDPAWQPPGDPPGTVHAHLQLAYQRLVRYGRALADRLASMDHWLLTIDMDHHRLRSIEDLAWQWSAIAWRAITTAWRGISAAAVRLQREISPAASRLQRKIGPATARLQQEISPTAARPQRKISAAAARLQPRLQHLQLNATRTWQARFRVGGTRWLAPAALLAVTCLTVFLVLDQSGADTSHARRLTGGQRTERRHGRGRGAGEAAVLGASTNDSRPSPGSTNPSPTGSTAPSSSSGSTAPSPSASTTSPIPVSPALAERLEAQGHEQLEAGRYTDAVLVLTRALAATGQRLQDCLQPTSEVCLTYAYALYDLGRALALDGHPAAAVPVLERRLQIDNQQSAVAAELAQARTQVG
jgi:tetratricopeptide (TPR) repeat protein